MWEASTSFLTLHSRLTGIMQVALSVASAVAKSHPPLGANRPLDPYDAGVHLLTGARVMQKQTP
jgi:hypothetical protein